MITKSFKIGTPITENEIDLESENRYYKFFITEISGFSTFNTEKLSSYYLKPTSYSNSK